MTNLMPGGRTSTSHAHHAGRVAALDVGSNSFHLLIAQLEEDGSSATIGRFKHEVQLGESVFARGAISQAAFARGLSVLDQLGAIVRDHRPEAVVAVATSALREASNGAMWVRTASRRTGLPIRIVGGLEEARLMLLGTRQSVPIEGCRVALFDVGGGSTEAIVADSERCVFSSSLKLGTLRLRGSPSAIDGSSASELACLRERAGEALRTTVDQVRKSGFDRVVLSCGVARRLLRLSLREAATASAQTAQHGGSRLTAAVLDELVQLLSARSERERAEIDRGDEAVDTLLPGAIVLRVLLDGLGNPDALVSTTGLREGLVADYARTRLLGRSFAGARRRDRQGNE